MVINRAKGTIEHRIFKDIIEYFDERTCSSSTIPKSSRHAYTAIREKTGAEIEIFLLRELNRELRLWDVLVTRHAKSESATNSISATTTCWWPR